LQTLDADVLLLQRTSSRAEAASQMSTAPRIITQWSRPWFTDGEIARDIVAAMGFAWCHRLYGTLLGAIAGAPGRRVAHA
jgi:hypothetical protein